MDSSSNSLIDPRTLATEILDMILLGEVSKAFRAE